MSNNSSSDHERVPLMNDTTLKEEEYFKENRLWQNDDEDGICCLRSWLLSPGILSLLGLPVLIV